MCLFAEVVTVVVIRLNQLAHTDAHPLTHLFGNTRNVTKWYRSKHAGSEIVRGLPIVNVLS